MKRHIHLILAFLLSSFLWFTIEESHAQTLRILPLGNSITEGSDRVTPIESERGSYRDQLYDELTGGGYSFDFVGHDSSGWNLVPDADHGGIPGTRGPFIVRLLQDGYDIRWGEYTTTDDKPYLDEYPADIILLHIGTNDIIPTGNDASAITDILDEIDNWEASSGTHVTVFIARIINRNPYNLTTTEYNNNLAAIVSGRGDPSVILVDMENGAGIDYSTEMMADGLHPLPAAYNKMGQTWYASLDAYLSAIPDSPENIVFGTVTSSTIQLNWTDNANNESGFDIERSLTPNGGDFALVGTTTANITSFESSGLAENTLYYFRVRAVNATGPSFYTAVQSTSTTTFVPAPPAAPSSLIFSPITSNTIQLNWLDNSSNEDGFEIFRSSTSGGTYQSIGTTGSNSTSFNNTGLSAATTYYYRVVAYNTGGSSAPVSGNATTLPDAPDAPSSLNFGPITTSSIQLNWTDNSGDEDGFKIFMSTSSGGTYNLIGTTAATSFNHTGLSEYTEYFYRVTAYNAGGTSAPASGSVRTDQTPPAAPGSLTFAPITNSSIQLNWVDNSSNENGFEILRASTLNGTYLSIAITSSGVTSYNNTGLADNEDYFYRVSAFNAGGSSAFISGNATTLPDPPNAPTNLIFNPITSSAITLNWSDNSNDEDGFEIWRSLVSGGPYTRIRTTGAGVETFTNTGLTNNTRYYYQVYAFNTGGPSAAVNGSAITLPLVPSGPGNLTFSSITNNSIRLNWTDNSNNEDGFEIYRSTSSGGSYVLVGTTGSGAQTFNHTGLSADTEYFYRVYAVNSGGSSVTYASGSESTLPFAPDAPSNLTFGTVSSTSIELNWRDNSDNEDEFEIFRSIYSWGLFASVGTTGPGVTTFNSTGLNSNTIYYFRVIAKNEGGSSPYVSGNERTLPDIPAAPTNLSFSSITSASIQLSWTDNSNNEDGFEVFRALSATGTYTSIIRLGPGMTTYNNVGLDPNTEYFYRVYAFNTGGPSTPVSGSASTLPDPPTAPSNLTTGLISTSSIQLIWSDNSNNEDGFRIFRSLSIGGPYASVGTTATGITSYDDVGLEDDTQYFYRVYAFNAGGNSDPAFVSASTLLEIPVNPSGLGARSNNTCAVDLDWDDNSDNEEGFEIERSSLSATAGFTLLWTVGPDVEAYADTSSENFSTYYYRIRAFNAAGYSDYSSVRSVSIARALSGGSIGTDQSVCPLGDPALLYNISSPSGGSNNWTYQWQSRSLTGVFANVDGATMLTYDPPVGIIESMEYQRVSTVECGSVASNLLTITVEDLEDPVFDSCPEDVLVSIERDQISASVVTEDPLVFDNCEIERLTWMVTGASTGISSLTGVNYLGTYDFNLGVSTVTYRSVDMSGNFAECSYEVTVDFNPPEILSVSIPDASMKIGDVISATITVATDGGSAFSMVSGELGGYPLYNFQRIDETTYLANFEVVEDGNSYLATEDIPVTNLVITDGLVQSLAYNLPIVQANDLLDAQLPVIGTVVAEAGIYSIGDVVILNISADGLNYDIHPSSAINGILVSEPNILFTELGGGIYRLSYVVQEGDNDVAPDELTASLMLVKPSGNIGLPYTEIGNINSVSIDAHAPVITLLEVSDIEVGVGGTVQVTITADEEGYIASAGTIINGIPLSSPRITFSERTGGLYEISYVVDAGDAEVAPGALSLSMVMTDPSGNSNEPYPLLESNTLEVYTDLPSALLADAPRICEGESADLTVILEGREPWSFDLYDGTDTTSYDDVTSSVFNITIAPLETTNYRILTVRDVNGVEDAGSRTVLVIVNEKTPVEIINLASGYNYETDPVNLEADIPGGTFSGPGVFNDPDIFDPGAADTINSPHTILYTYVNSNGCVSVDSALVFVLGTDGGIYIPSDLVCQNGDSFTVNASNISGVTGTFTLFDSEGEAVDGLTDNGDNSAEINPGELLPGNYTIEYEYVDRATLYLTRTFVVESVPQPAILNLEDAYCQNVDPFLLESDMEGVVFEGPGVSGSPDSGFVFNPGIIEPGGITIYCTASSESDCEAFSEQLVWIAFSPDVDFAMSSSCIADSGGSVKFDNLTYGKLEVETWTWNFGDPESGENNTSDLVSPEHYYESTGQRSVSLRGAAVNGCISEKTLDISIGDHVSADFTWTSDCYSEDSQIQFLDRSNSGNSSIDTLIWRFKTSEGEIMDEIVTGSGSEDISYQFASSGSYVVELIASNNMGCSDSTSSDLNLRETIILSAEAYVETFNLDQGDWNVFAEDQHVSWTWDVPDFDGFIPNPGDNAWFTHLPDDQIDYHEDSWVQSPCFDFTGITKPMISMDIMRSFVPERDGAVLQYLVNREEGWQTVGELASGIEWYNSSDITNEPGGSSLGWSLEVDNPDQTWVSVAHNLDMLTKVPNAMLRIALGSNGREGIGNQGFAFDNVGISERTKLTVIEHFTNSADAASNSADDIVDALATENSSDVVDIQYHMNIPGEDPMNENNPGSAATRSFNYGIPSVPYAVLNGGVDEEDRFDFSELKSTLATEQVLELALQKPLFDVELEVNWLEGGLETSTLVTCNADSYDDNIQLYVVVFETSVTQYTGLNGDTEFRNVVLDMLPTPAGKLLGGNWRMGDDDFRENNWTYQPYVEHIDDLAVIAFVQNRNTNQILQADVVHKSPQVGTEKRFVEVEALHIYPNPASSFVNVNLGRPAEKDGRFEIIDMNGRVVHNENVPMGYQIYQLEVGALNRGFYMIQWYEGGILRGRNKLITVD